MVHYLQGMKPNTKGRDYLSRGGRLLQLRRGPTEANSEGGEREGLSEAHNAWERSLSHKGSSRIALEVGWLVNCGEDRLGNVTGSTVLISRALSSGRRRRQAEGMASKCGRGGRGCESPPEGTGSKCAEVGGDGKFVLQVGASGGISLMGESPCTSVIHSHFKLGMRPQLCGT